MKLLSILTSSLLAVASFANAGVRENGGMFVPAAARLAFTSPGNGIDWPLKATVEALIKEYQDAGKVLSYTQQAWGFEGEVTICVQLKELHDSRKLNKKLQQLVEESPLRKTNVDFVSSCEVNEAADELLRTR